MELGSAVCVDAVVKGQAESTYPEIHINGFTYYLMLSTPNVPVPAYACSADAAASMSLLKAHQKPTYNHATDAQADQSAVVQSGTGDASWPAQYSPSEAVATMYPMAYSGHVYGMSPLRLRHCCMLLDCFQQGKMAGTHITSVLSSLVCCGLHRVHQKFQDVEGAM